MTSTLVFFASRAVSRSTRVLLLAIGLAALGGCATGPNPRDPLEPFNRRMMEFNEGVDVVVFRPSATIYKKVVPPIVRTGVSNFFGNLSDAWSMVNSLLQFKFLDAGESFARLNLNTFFGLGGIIDVASELNVERHREDFGQTLGRWGVPPGPYIVLPLLGPSTLRDTFALPVDMKADPLSHIDPLGSRSSFYLLRVLDQRSNLLRASSVLDEAALDKYSFTRDAHLQRRRAEIFENKASETDGQEPKVDGTAAPLPGATPAAAPASASGQR